MQPRPRKWNVPEDKRNEVKNLLLSSSGVEDIQVTEASRELWRIRINNAVFTQYATGTLVSNPTSDEHVLKIREKISELVGSEFQNTDREYMIGLDETGKGEVLGHSVLAGVAYPSSLSGEIENLISVTDTKKKREEQYWDQLFIEIDKLKKNNLLFVSEKIPPWHIDQFNTNKIMDVVYHRIISGLLKRVPTEKCSIILDDYGIGKNLSEFLKSLEKMGALVRVETRADDTYLEAKLVSAIAKGVRETMMQAINKRFGFEDCPIGSGNASDPLTIKWLSAWKKTGKPWPWFVKKSFANIRKLDGKVGEVKKQNPPIRHELISSESQDLFSEGKLSVTSLSILCPDCGQVSKSAKIIPNESGYIEGRCVSCNEVIRDLNTTLLYYNGYLIPDSSVIMSGTLSKDLDKGKFFENFTILLHPAVRRECDNRGGKAELGRIADNASIGRTGLMNLEEAVDDSKTNNEQIVDGAKKYDAIVLTRDQGMYARASGMEVFVLK